MVNNMVGREILVSLKFEDALKVNCVRDCSIPHNNRFFVQSFASGAGTGLIDYGKSNEQLPGEVMKNEYEHDDWLLQTSRATSILY